MNARILSRRLSIIALALAPLTAFAQDNAQLGAGTIATNVNLPRYPALSRDAKTIAFTWRGDLFTVPLAGGTATRLTTNAYDDLYSAFSPDGKRLAFTSARNGAGNLFTMALDGTDLQQVTFSDRPFLLTQWGKDAAGKEKLFTAAILDVQAFTTPQLWEVSPEGGDPDRITPAEGTYPNASPDGKKLLITRGASPWPRRGYHGSQNRDVWVYDRDAKTFTQLTTYDGNDGKAKWADNNTVLFLSDRNANTHNLFSLKLSQPDNAAVQLTQFTDKSIDDFDVAPGTGTVVFARWDKLYTFSLGALSRWNKDSTLTLGAGEAAGTEPRPIPIRANEEEADRVRFQSAATTVSETALSPDGKTLAIVSYGEIYVRGVDAKSPTRRVTTNLGGRKRDIAWAADGARLLFVCDETGKEELYEANVKLTRSDIRKKALGDPATRPSATDEPAVAAAAGGPTGASTQPATQPAVMPPKTPEDEVADQVRRGPPPGATPAPGATGAAPTPLPAAVAGELSRWGDALAFTVHRLFPAERAHRQPTPSPDGKFLAYVAAGAESGYELRIRAEPTLGIFPSNYAGTDKVLIKSPDSFDFRWSPDSKYIAYATDDRNNNSDIWLAPADGSEKPVNLSRHPNGDVSPRFSADGKILAFLSNRTGAGDEMAVYTVYLDKDLESFAQPELDAYYRDAASAARRRTAPATRPSATSRPSSRPATTTATTAAATTATTTESDNPETVTIGRRRRGPATTQAVVLPLKRDHLEDAYLRIRRVTNLRGSVSDLEISPAGDKFYFNGYLGSTRALLSQSRDTSEPTRLASSVNLQNMSLAGDTIAVVDSGAPRTPNAGEGPAPRGASRAGILKLTGGEVEYYDPNDRLEIDLAKQSEQKFLEASRLMSNLFYNPQMNGVDWKANTAAYLPLAMAARTPDEFDFIANRYIGELNASHLGINAPSSNSPLAQTVGKLGIKTERHDAKFKDSTTNPAAGYSHLEVTDVMPEGPSDKGQMKLKKGDIITAIDFTPIAYKDTLDKLLLGKSGSEVVVSILREGQPLDLLLIPTSTLSLSDLAYNRWRLETAKKVAEMSNGRIGYIHIQGMNQSSLETYKRDLYAACDGKDGMIIDVRWNGGGSTADLLLASIMSAHHAYTVPRGEQTHKDSYPTDRLFIPRFVGPINMLCNERSFSNAEIISHAFKTLKRGTLVGNTTAGGVISTGAASLLDGTSIRIPGRGWYVKGTDKNMELNGAEPDIKLPQTPDDELALTDRQLKAAVDDLLKRLP